MSLSEQVGGESSHEAVKGSSSGMIPSASGSSPSPMELSVGIALPSHNDSTPCLTPLAVADQGEDDDQDVVSPQAPKRMRNASPLQTIDERDAVSVPLVL